MLWFACYMLSQIAGSLQVSSSADSARQNWLYKHKFEKLIEFYIVFVNFSDFF